MTKEERKEYNKAHYLKNKERLRLNKIKWRLDNKEYNSNYYHNVLKTGDYRVYLLPNTNYYVGYTSAEKHRMYNHRNSGNDTTDYEILHICDTEKEAKWFEKFYHNLGFHGKKGSN